MPVRGFTPPDRASARTYDGQDRAQRPVSARKQQVRRHMPGPGQAVCKTVGSAYVGSNPTPATTCENGPRAAETRPGGRFLLVTVCIRLCHCGSMRSGVHGRIADGVRAARTVGAHRRLFRGRPRTGPGQRRISRLARAAGPGVPPPCPPGPCDVPGEGGPGTWCAGDRGGGPGEAVTPAGRAIRAGVTGRGAHGVPGCALLTGRRKTAGVVSRVASVAAHRGWPRRGGQTVTWPGLSHD